VMNRSNIYYNMEYKEPEPRVELHERKCHSSFDKVRRDTRKQSKRHSNGNNELLMFNPDEPILAQTAHKHNSMVKQPAPVLRVSEDKLNSSCHLQNARVRSSLTKSEIRGNLPMKPRAQDQFNPARFKKNPRFTITQHED
jgi:hypothetical protein